MGALSLSTPTLLRRSKAPEQLTTAPTLCSRRRSAAMSSWFRNVWEFVLSLFANVDWRAVPAFLGGKLVEGLFQAIAVVVIGWLVLYRQWRQLMQGRSDQVICCLLSIARLIIRGSASYHWASTSTSRSSSLHCKSTGTVISRIAELGLQLRGAPVPAAAK
jgi:hypothetical protein